MIENTLKWIGLSDKEAKVYLANLELGESSAQKIAEKAGVNRATTYVILESLTEKDVIEVKEEGKRTFVAKGPYALKNLIQDQREEIQEKKDKLQKLFPKLKKVHNVLPNRPVVKYYEGKEAVQSVREQFLTSKSKEIHAIYSEDEVNNIFPEEDRERFRKRRNEIGIKSHSIYNPSEEKGLKKSREGYDFKAVPKEKYHFPCDISTFDEYLAISILAGYPSSILIESEAIANTFRSIFKLAYEAAEEYDSELKAKEA